MARPGVKRAAAKAAILEFLERYGIAGLVVKRRELAAVLGFTTCTIHGAIEELVAAGEVTQVLERTARLAVAYGRPPAEGGRR